MDADEVQALTSMMRWIIGLAIGVPIGGILLGHVVVYFLELFGQLPPTDEKG